MRRLVTPFVALIAVVSLGFGITAFVRAGSRVSAASLSGRLSAVEHQIGALRTREAGLSSSVAASTGRLGPLTARVKKIEACIPELTAYVNGIQPQVSNGVVSLQYIQQVSSYCSGLIYTGR